MDEPKTLQEAADELAMAIGAFGDALMEAFKDLLQDPNFQETLEMIKALVNTVEEEQPSVHWTSRGEQFEEARKLPPTVDVKYTIVPKIDPQGKHHRRQHRG